MQLQPNTHHLNHSCIILLFLYILLILLYKLSKIDLSGGSSIQKINFLQIDSISRKFTKYHASLKKLEQIKVSTKTAPERFFERGGLRSNITIGRKSGFYKGILDPNPKTIEISELKCSETQNYTVYVKSSLKTGRFRRDYIRNTWGKNKPVIFVLSSDHTKLTEKVRSEIKENKDILILYGYQDSWSNLSFKILAILKHVHSCNFSKSIVITDDDVYWFLDLLEGGFAKMPRK